ncbi:isoprenylcysteine carboxylmethyltransferase family protein [Cyclobacteriaceae bacterium YHN15]|jgi:methanethiol S-methyltransferase|nr:isoprenylcysteine carboxylmethyltransferase family protein [Cyclobacteriaceae bacterium YHN15]
MHAYLYLALFWAVFYFLHTYLANLEFKIWLRTKLRFAYKYYRLIYSLFSTLYFLFILLYGTSLEKKYVLGMTDLTTYLGYMLAAFGTIILVKAFKHFSLSTFSGMKPHDDLEEVHVFVRKGLHQYIRHPLYAGLVLIFLGFFFFEPVLASLIHLACLVIYLPFGIYFEEKKLIRIYGDTYIQYKKEVPAILPTKFRR